MPYTPYKQATLIVRKDPNFPPISTVKSPFDPTISATPLQPFKPFFALHRVLLSFVTSTEIPKGLKTSSQRDHNVKFRFAYCLFISVNKSPTYKPTYVRKNVPEVTRKNIYIAPNGQ